MRRATWVWPGFAAALAVALGVMVFFTVRVLQFERATAEAQAQAALEETVRLALWRMDSAAAVLLRDGMPRTLVANRAESQESAPIQQRYEPQRQTLISKQEFQQREAIAPETGGDDWRTIEPQLLERIADLLPGAHLEAVSGKSPDDTRRLASVPARLVVPASARPDAALPWNTPLRVSLMAAWVGVLLAAGAVAWLLAGTLALSRRRGDFAAAVTHELRTPLTTMRMYAEMLSTGMVEDADRRVEYLRTLATESDRLGRLVENVLAYSRMENRLSRRNAEALRIGQLLEQTLPALRRRVEQEGRELLVEIGPSAENSTVRTDPVGVQQVLLNLVDNACKHGKPPVRLRVSAGDGRVEIAVSDEGPGLAAGSRPFTAFGKAKSDPAPGIGLGLFLSRQVAREMGGDLEHRAGGKGAEFVLVLPA